MKAQRMWINQPSALQALHALHGTNVIATNDGERTMRVYFLNGAIESQQVPGESLAIGWRLEQQWKPS